MKGSLSERDILAFVHLHCSSHIAGTKWDTKLAASDAIRYLLELYSTTNSKTLGQSKIPVSTALTDLRHILSPHELYPALEELLLYVDKCLSEIDAAGRDASDNICGLTDEEKDRYVKNMLNVFDGVSDKDLLAKFMSVVKSMQDDKLNYRFLEKIRKIKEKIGEDIDVLSSLSRNSADKENYSDVSTKIKSIVRSLHYLVQICKSYKNKFYQVAEYKGGNIEYLYIKEKSTSVGVKKPRPVRLHINRLQKHLKKMLEDSQGRAIYISLTMGDEPGQYLVLKLKCVDQNNIDSGLMISVIDPDGVELFDDDVYQVSTSKSKATFVSSNVTVMWESSELKDFLTTILDMAFSPNLFASGLKVEDVSNSNSLAPFSPAAECVSRLLLLTSNDTSTSRTTIVLPSSTSRNAAYEMKAARSVIKDIVAEGCSGETGRNAENEVALHMLFLKFASLQRAFARYENGEDIPPRELLQIALNEFRNRVTKYQHAGLLTIEESLPLIEFSNTFSEDVAAKEEKSKQTAQPNLEGKYSSKKDNAEEAKLVATVEELKQPGIVDKVLRATEVESIDPITKERVVEAVVSVETPKNVLDILNNLFPNYENIDVNALYHILRRLPKTSAEAKDVFWDKLSQDEATELVIKMLELIIAVTSEEIVKLSNAGSVSLRRIVCLMLYDIVAQLAHNVDDLKLQDDESIGLPVELMDRSIFTDANMYHIAASVHQNFARRRSKAPKEIFLDRSHHCQITEEPNQETENYVQRYFAENGKFNKYLEALLHSEIMKGHPIYGDFENFIKHCEIEDIATRKKLVVEAILWREQYRYNNINYKQRHPMERFNEKFKDPYSRERPVQVNQPEKIKEKYLPRVFLALQQAARGVTKLNKEQSVARSLGSSSTIVLNGKSIAVDRNRAGQSSRIGILHQDSLESILYTPSVSENNDKALTTIPFQSEENFEPHLAVLEQELRVLEAADHLRVARTLSWCLANRNKLYYGTVRQFITHLLFEFGKLDVAFTENFSETLLLLQQFFNAIFAFYMNKVDGIPFREINQNSYFSTQLWLVRTYANITQYLQVHVSRHQDALSNIGSYSLPDPRRYMMQKLYAAKSKYEKALYAKHALHVLGAKGILSDTDREDMLVCLVISSFDKKNLSLRPHCVDKNELAVDTIKSKYLVDLVHYVKRLTQDQLTALINNVLAASGLTIATDTTWRISAESSTDDFYINSSCNEYRLHFPSLRLEYLIHEITQSAWFPVIAEQINLADDPVINYLKLDVNILGIRQLTENLFLSEDKQWYFVTNKDNNVATVYRNIRVSGAVKEFSLDCNNFNVSGSVSTWVCTDNKQEKLRIDSSNPDVIYLYQPSIDELCWDCYQPNTAGDWTFQNKKLFWLNSSTDVLNISPWLASWQSYFNRYSFAAVCMHMDTSGDNITLIKVEFAKLNLSFIAQDSRLCLATEPDVVLLEHQKIKFLPGISQLFKLQHKKDKTEKVIIPNYNLAGIRLEEDRRVSWLDKTSSSQQPYFSYTVAAETGELIGDSLAATFYLAMLYRFTHQYERAAATLDKTYTYKANSNDIVELLNLLDTYSDNTLEGIAFKLKLYARMLWHINKFTKDNLNATDKNTSSEYGFPQIQELYQFYLNAISSRVEGISAIPHYLRLSSNEHEILANFKDYLPGADNSKVRTLAKATPTRRLDTISACRDFNIDKALQMLQNFDFFIDEDFLSIQQEDLLKQARISVYSSICAISNKCGRGGAFDDRPYKDIIQLASNPGLLYLYKFFPLMLSAAIQPSTDNYAQLRAQLWMLLCNDSVLHPLHVKITAMLLVVMNNPQHFQDFDVSNNNRSELLQTLAGKCADISSSLDCDATVLIQSKSATHKKTATPAKSYQSDIDPTAQYLELLPKNMQQPLASILEENFNEEYRAIADGDFKFAVAGYDMSPLTRKIFEHYQAGHEENLRLTRRHFVKKDGVTLQMLCRQLREQHQADKEQIHTMPDAILAAANIMPSDEVARFEFELRLKTEQTGQITIDDIIDAILTQNHAVLLNKNPHLTANEINNLLNDTVNYMLITSRYQQVLDAEEIIQNKGNFEDLSVYSQQVLARTLARKRQYTLDASNPHERIFLVYEYNSGNMLREDQLDALKKLIAIIDNPAATAEAYKHTLLQFAAGGGKTAVLLPILARYMASKGWLPVIFNTSELYHIGKEDIPNSLAKSFKQKFEVIERGLEDEWTAKELQTLLRNLEQWRQSGRCVLMEPVTWYSIKIAHKLAYVYEDEELAVAAKNVLDFFYEKTVKLEDEGHLITDPLQLCIKTYGDKKGLPETQQDLLLRLYDCLLNFDGKSADIASLAGILESDSKKELTAAELESLQEKLIDRICANDILQYRDIPQDELKEYLSVAKDSEKFKTLDLWLKQLYVKNPNAANLLKLARGFIKTHLPYILTLQLGKDYGESIHPGDLTVAPKHDGEDVRAHHAITVLIAELSIQYYAQKGLKSEHVFRILEELYGKHINERARSNSLTRAEKRARELLGEDYENFYFDEQTIDILKVLSNEIKVRKSPKMIQAFLKQAVFPQIKTPVKRVTATPAELQAGFKRSVIFTATPGLRQAYPIFLPERGCIFNAAFEAEVIQTLFSDNNANAYLIEETSNPFDFFAQLKTQNAKLFKQMQTLIDRGGLLTTDNTTAVIDAFLECCQGDEELSQIAACFTGDAMALRSLKPEDIQSMTIPGSKLEVALKAKGLDIREVLLFLFLDLSKTTGTDNKRPITDKAGLTIGKGQTVTETIQAAMRERQLLEQNAQSISWIMFTSLYKAICPADKAEARQAPAIDLREVFFWKLKNQSKRSKSKIIQRAFQGIDQQIESWVWQQIDAGTLKYAEVKDFFEADQPNEPFHLFEIPCTMHATQEVLKLYFARRLQSINLTKEPLPQAVTNNVNSIISETAELIDKLPMVHNTESADVFVSHDEALAAEVTQEQEEMTEEEVKQELEAQSLAIDEGEKLTFNIEEYTENDSLDRINMTYMSYYSFPSAKVEPSPDGWPSFYYGVSHFRAFGISQDNAKQDKKEYFKPIASVLVVIKEDGTFDYLACTVAGAEFYQMQIRQRSEGDNKKFLLVDTNGNVLTASNSFALQEQSKICDGDKLQETLAFINLLNGVIVEPDKLARIIKRGYVPENAFDEVIDYVKQLHIAEQPIELAELEYVKDLCGWRKPQGKIAGDAKEEVVVVEYHEPNSHFPGSKVDAAVDQIWACKAPHVQVASMLPAGVKSKGYVLQAHGIASALCSNAATKEGSARVELSANKLSDGSSVLSDYPEAKAGSATRPLLKTKSSSLPNEVFKAERAYEKAVLATKKAEQAERVLKQERQDLESLQTKFKRFENSLNENIQDILQRLFENNELRGKVQKIALNNFKAMCGIAGFTTRDVVDELINLDALNAFKNKDDVKNFLLLTESVVISRINDTFSTTNFSEEDNFSEDAFFEYIDEFFTFNDDFSAAISSMGGTPGKTELSDTDVVALIDRINASIKHFADRCGITEYFLVQDSYNLVDNTKFNICDIFESAASRQQEAVKLQETQIPEKQKAVTTAEKEEAEANKRAESAKAHAVTKINAACAIIADLNKAAEAAARKVAEGAARTVAEEAARKAAEAAARKIAEEDARKVVEEAAARKVAEEAARKAAEEATRTVAEEAARKVAAEEARKAAAEEAARLAEEEARKAAAVARRAAAVRRREVGVVAHKGVAEDAHRTSQVDPHKVTEAAVEYITKERIEALSGLISKILNIKTKKQEAKIRMREQSPHMVCFLIIANEIISSCSNSALSTDIKGEIVRLIKSMQDQIKDEIHYNTLEKAIVAPYFASLFQYFSDMIRASDYFSGSMFQKDTTQVLTTQAQTDWTKFCYQTQTYLLSVKTVEEELDRFKDTVQDRLTKPRTQDVAIIATMTDAFRPYKIHCTLIREIISRGKPKPPSKMSNVASKGMAARMTQHGAFAAGIESGRESRALDTARHTRGRPGNPAGSRRKF